MGIMQFFFLSLIVLVYLLIVGGLVGRMVARSANEMKKHSAPKHEEIMA